MVERIRVSVFGPESTEPLDLVQMFWWDVKVGGASASGGLHRMVQVFWWEAKAGAPLVLAGLIGAH